MNPLPGRRLFIDMDGVLADFDKGYEKVFETKLLPRNVREDGAPGGINWEWVRGTPGFFRNLPPMPGAKQLWNFASRQGAYILSGCPDRFGSNIAWEKRMWVKANLGKDIPTITCPSKEKCLYAHYGDVLVDDWEKYQSKWEAVGGVWITFKDMPQVITELRKLGYD